MEIYGILHDISILSIDLKIITFEYVQRSHADVLAKIICILYRLLPILFRFNEIKVIFYQKRKLSYLSLDLKIKMPK